MFNVCVFNICSHFAYVLAPDSIGKGEFHCFQGEKKGRKEGEGTGTQARRAAAGHHIPKHAGLYSRAAQEIRSLIDTVRQ